MDFSRLPFRDTWVPVCHRSVFDLPETIQRLMGENVHITHGQEGMQVKLEAQGETLLLQHTIINDFLAVWIGEGQAWELKPYALDADIRCAHDINEVPVSIVAMTSDAVDFAHFEFIHKLYDIDHTGEYRGHESFLDMHSSNAELSDHPIMARLVNLTRGKLDAGFRTRTRSYSQGPFIADNTLEPYGFNFSVVNLYIMIPRDIDKTEIHNVYHYHPMTMKFISDGLLASANETIKNDFVEGYRDSLAADFPYWKRKDANKHKLVNDPNFAEYIDWIRQFVSDDILPLHA